jgi:hypothetical protein
VIVAVSRLCENAGYGTGIGGYVVALNAGAEMGRDRDNEDRVGGDR